MDGVSVFYMCDRCEHMGSRRGTMIREYVLILLTNEYVMLHAKQTLHVGLRISKWCHYSGLTLWDKSNLKGPYKEKIQTRVREGAMK